MEAALRQGPQEQVQALARSLYALSPSKKRRLRSAVRFRKLGLGIQSIAKLLNSDNREISRLLKAATVLGFLESEARRWPMSSEGLLPATLLSRACARIRWQQRLLCGLPTHAMLEVDARDAEGLYYTLEDIYEDVTAALRSMEDAKKA